MSIPNQTYFDPEVLFPPEPRYGPTITFQESFHIARTPHEVYDFVARTRHLIQALPELRVLRVVNGESYFWKLEYPDFWLDGEFHVTQRTHKDIVVWQSHGNSDTQVSGSLRFHACDDPVVSEDDESPSTRLALTMHWRIPEPVVRKLGASVLEERLGSTFREAVGRIKRRLEETAPAGLRTEGFASEERPAARDEKSSPLR